MPPCGPRRTWLRRLVLAGIVKSFLISLLGLSFRETINYFQNGISSPVGPASMLGGMSSSPLDADTVALGRGALERDVGRLPPSDGPSPLGVRNWTSSMWITSLLRFWPSFSHSSSTRCPRSEERR